MAGRRMFGGALAPVNQEGCFVSTIAESLRQGLTRALLPPTCCLCGAPGERADLDLCEECVNLLPVNPPTGGNAPSSATSPLFASTLIRVVVPFHYAYPVDHWIRALKFNGERVYARVLAALLVNAFRALRQPPPQLIVPIPLHPRRYRERGFNQAHELAKFAAPPLGIQINAHCLARELPTLEQSSLPPAQRRKNVRGAFTVVRPVGADRVALLDDVLTTGSTALAAAQALRAAGVREVELWAVARVTPKPPSR
jgi:ComF family protein